MRESYRAKQSRKARINREKQEKSAPRVREQKSKNPKGADREFRNRKPEYKPKEKFNDNFEQDENSYDDVIAGRNAVLELLKSGKDINKIFVEQGERYGSITEIIARAKEDRVVLVEVPKSKLDFMAENHQGVVAVVPPFDYCEVQDILDYAKSKNEDPFILILDGIEDVHNLGAIIRTAETAGVHGVIIPKRRNASVNSTVAKVSAGAVSYVKIARSNNLNDSIRYLKDQGLWIIGTDGDGEKEYYNQDLTGPIAIIIGSEGYGMSSLVKKNADILVKIPMFGKITSLNASVSSGIVIYEAVKQRQLKM